MYDYSKMTDDDFTRILEEIVNEMTVAEILSYSDIDSMLREELNNVILSRWEKENEENE